MDTVVISSLDTENIYKCRCCLNRQSSSDLSEEYTNISQEKGLYETMLENTFNIQIKSYNFVSNKICSACTIKLKDAVDFKNQVLQAEVILGSQYEEWTKTTNQIICAESSELLKQEIDTDIFDSGFTNNAIEEDLICKNESDHETSQNENNINSDLCDKEILIKLESLVQRDEMEKKKTNLNKAKNRKKISKADGTKNVSDRDEDAEKLQELILNTIQLVTNSNMIIFISKKTKFACFYCKKTYLHITTLREHYKEHTFKEINNQITTNICKSRGLSCKNVDISNLSCNNCSYVCNDLRELQNHLSIHGLVFKTNKNLLVPYKLEDGFRCLLCDADFKTFCKLSIHMNSHSTSNICEICGEAYVNRRSLRNHLDSVHKEKKCSVCLAVFPNISTKLKHMRIAHKIIKNKRYCLQCKETFKYSYQLNKHMIDSHGVKRELEKCEFCNKLFSPISLRTHIRSVHIGERNHPCTLCKMRFFTSFDRKRHEMIHRDEKLFSCENCEGRFKTKDSMRRHLLRQHHSEVNN